MIYNFDTTYTNLDGDLFQKLKLPKIENSELTLLNHQLFKDLGIETDDNLTTNDLLGSDDFVEGFAQAYSGHQFGHFTNLGDGRAMILGEQITPKNERFDIQLKGSGITKYSRGGDGKATISSMVREYIYSYGMEKLGVATSKSLAIISTGDKVMRYSLHDGAILFRVMSSHIRFGTFEYLYRFCSTEQLKRFTDYVIDRHYSELNVEKDKYLLFYRSVINKTIEMVVEWYRVGFIHGVMNTDNMSIIGETFDYGPCAFINSFDSSAVYSEIDKHERYSFGNQRKILLWNLGVLGETLLSLIDCDQEIAIGLLRSELDLFNERFNTQFYNMMKRKLGIVDQNSHKELIDRFLGFMESNQLDYTNTFIELMRPNSFENPIYQSEPYLKIRGEIEEVGLDLELMKRNNPQRILRNYLVEEALEDHRKNGSLDKVNDLLKAVNEPYLVDNNFAKYQQPPSKQFDENYRTHCNT